MDHPKILLDYQYGAEMLDFIEGYFRSKRHLWVWQSSFDAHEVVDYVRTFARIGTSSRSVHPLMSCMIQVGCHSPGFCYVDLMLRPPADSYGSSDYGINKSSRNLKQTDAKRILATALEAIERTVARQDAEVRCNVFRRRLMRNVRLSL